MSPRPDTHDSSSSTSVVVAAPSPQKPAKRVVTGVAMVEDAAAAAVVAVAVENPYLAGLGKKTRGLKKKLENWRVVKCLLSSLYRLVMLRLGFLVKLWLILLEKL